MKSISKILALAVLATANLAVFAQGQASVTIPASSAATAGRAVVSVTPMTAAQVQGIVAAAPPSAGAPWSMNFVGQTISTGNWESFIVLSGIYGGPSHIRIDASGNLIGMRMGKWGWQEYVLGRPYLNSAVLLSSCQPGAAQETATVYVGPSTTADASGRPIGWSIYGTRCMGAGFG